MEQTVGITDHSPSPDHRLSLYLGGEKEEINKLNNTLVSYSVANKFAEYKSSSRSKFCINLLYRHFKKSGRSFVSNRTVLLTVNNRIDSQNRSPKVNDIGDRTLLDLC